jgi:hypothetical protein
MFNDCNNKLVGAIFLLISSVLYATDRICHYLFMVATSNMGVVYEENSFSIDNWFNLILSIAFLLIGIFLLIIGNRKK